MAHSRNLSNRIERLLNDSSFRLAFSGGRRALLALVLPVAVIAATAMVRVEAAQLPQSDAPALPFTQAPVVVLAKPLSAGQANRPSSAGNPAGSGSGSESGSGACSSAAVSGTRTRGSAIP